MNSKKQQKPKVVGRKTMTRAILLLLVILVFSAQGATQSQIMTMAQKATSKRTLKCIPRYGTKLLITGKLAKLTARISTPT